jgi:6-pyruvoyltetrahydropterin/6-carboxytetrahydropterin synthase
LPAGQWKISLSKDAHKFSSTHLTIFPDGTKEALHGHNYQVSLNLQLAEISFKKMLPFSPLKKTLKSICDTFDEKILIAEKNPFVTVVINGGAELEFKACGKRYVFPKDEVVLLALENITVELLAKEVSDRFWRGFCADPNVSSECKALVTGLEVCIEETLGQSATYYRSEGNLRVEK